MIPNFTRVTKALAIFAMLSLAACGDVPEAATAQAVEPLGDFKLGFAVVVAANAEKGPLSRDATEEQLIAALKPGLERSLQGYTGSKFYNVSVAVNAYVLAQPGIPIVFSPKSALVISVNVWDDAKGVLVTEEHKQITILERITGENLILGSGLTQTAEQQLAGLSSLAIVEVNKWLRENEDKFVADASGT